MSSMGERFAELRTEHGLSIKDTAELVGVVPSAWSRWERGMAYPRSKAIKAVCDAFGVEARWLTSGLGEKTTVAAEQKAEELEAKKKDEACTTYSVEDEERLKDINIIMRAIKDLNVSKERKRHIHKTMSAYRTELESVVLFGEVS